jgi:hypothetical protein
MSRLGKMSSRSRQPKKNNRRHADGGSSQPAQQPLALSLLGINRECRDLILEMLLQNKSGPWSGNVVNHEVEPIHLSIPWVGDHGNTGSPYKISTIRLFIGNVNILLACRQLCMEGRHMLYGRNSFISYNFPQLKYRLPPIIGRENMRLIRKVSIGVPVKYKRDPAPYLGGFLEFLKEKLPNVVELNLTTKFYLFDRPLIKGSNNSRVSEEIRAMLHTSAWITCKHPLLKKAIWLVESGGTLRSPLIEYPTWPWPHADGDQSDSSSEPSGLEDSDGTSSQTGGDMVAKNGYGITDNSEENEEEHPEDFGRDMTDDVDQCCLTVNILATDRRFRMREQSRIDLVPRITKLIARVCSARSTLIHSTGN